MLPESPIEGAESLGRRATCERIGSTKTPRSRNLIMICIGGSSRNVYNRVEWPKWLETGNFRATNSLYKIFMILHEALIIEYKLRSLYTKTLMCHFAT